MWLDETLSPCPFCGGKAAFRMKPFKRETGVCYSTLYIQCTVCAAQTRPETVKVLDEDSDLKRFFDYVDPAEYVLRDAWNRRAVDGA